MVLTASKLMTTLNCIHVPTVALRTSEVTVEITPSKSWRRGTETSGIMSNLDREGIGIHG